MYDSVPDVQFWIKNRDGIYIAINKFFLQNYLVSDDSKILGRTDFEIAPEFIARHWNADDDTVLQGKCITNRIELVCQSDHSIAWHITNKRPIKGTEGVVIGSCGTTRKFQDTEPSTLPFANMMPAIEHIRSHINRPILTDTLACLVHMSVSTFERKFKKHFNDSPAKFIKKLRLSLACQKLLSTDLPISEIANICGFCDQSYMTKEFHRVMAVTPREYKAAAFNDHRRM
nr:helix-turn-helix domain-containing protein [Paraglaciecola arctica]